MRPELTFIVAGNIDEFSNYLRDKQAEGKNYVYVDGPHVFRGRRDVHGFYIGSYKKRADIDEIMEAIKIANFKSTVYVSSTPMSDGASQWLRGLTANGIIIDEVADLQKI